MKTAIATILCGVMLFAAGCASNDAPVASFESRKLIVSGKNYGEVWQAVRDAASKDLKVVQISKGRGTVRAESEGGLISSAEAIAIFVRPPTRGAARYEIEVRSEKKSRLKFGEDRIEPVIESIKADLGL